MWILELILLATLLLLLITLKKRGVLDFSVSWFRRQSGSYSPVVLLLPILLILLQLVLQFMNWFNHRP